FEDRAGLGRIEPAGFLDLVLERDQLGFDEAANGADDHRLFFGQIELHFYSPGVERRRAAERLTAVKYSELLQASESSDAAASITGASSCMRASVRRTLGTATL